MGVPPFLVVVFGCRDQCFIGDVCEVGLFVEPVVKDGVEFLQVDEPLSGLVSGSDAKKFQG